MALLILALVWWRTSGGADGLSSRQQAHMNRLAQDVAHLQRLVLAMSSDLVQLKPDASISQHWEAWKSASHYGQLLERWRARLRAARQQLDASEAALGALDQAEPIACVGGQCQAAPPA